MFDTPPDVFRFPAGEWSSYWHRSYHRITVENGKDFDPTSLCSLFQRYGEMDDFYSVQRGSFVMLTYKNPDVVTYVCSLRGQLEINGNNVQFIVTGTTIGITTFRRCLTSTLPSSGKD